MPNAWTTVILQDQRAVVILEKTPFNRERIVDVLTVETRMEKQFQNDVYGKYDCNMESGSGYNVVRANVICPATEKHVAKYQTTSLR